MKKIIERTIEWYGKALSLQVGRLANQADSGVLVSYGNTKILCTISTAAEPEEGIDFFPLVINFLAKSYAFGRIPGGFFKREGKPSEKEVLISRIIDRAVRPLLSDLHRCPTHVTCTLLAHDASVAPEVPAVIGVSAGLMLLQSMDFDNPVVAVHVSEVNNELVVNPDTGDSRNSALNIVVAGTSSEVVMIEAGAKEKSEEEVLSAIDLGHAQVGQISCFISEFVVAVKESRESNNYGEVSNAEEAGMRSAQFAMIDALVVNFINADYLATFKHTSKKVLDKQWKHYNKEIVNSIVAKHADVTELEVKASIDRVLRAKARQEMLHKGLRLDGRDFNEVRNIDIEIDTLPGTHGSALFTRGNTQALVVVTLGTAQDEQILDGMDDGADMRERFMLHYNFPPFSVGDVAAVRNTPGRREVGHGRLAHKAYTSMLPSKSAFPYTIRVVSEILESDGSSSMATVCGTSLALMDAGVPLAKPVAGIAMGLIKEGDFIAVLSDISGVEDKYGDMDFKVAGTESGITALQMDIKIKGISIDIMRQALQQARDGRMHILQKMGTAIDMPRGKTKGNAPSVRTIQIPTSRIKDIIGPGGKVIKEICEKYNVKVDIEQSGSVNISSSDQDNMDAACDFIINTANSAVDGPSRGPRNRPPRSSDGHFNRRNDQDSSSGRGFVGENARDKGAHHSSGSYRDRDRGDDRRSRPVNRTTKHNDRGERFNRPLDQTEVATGDTESVEADKGRGEQRKAHNPIRNRSTFYSNE